MDTIGTYRTSQSTNGAKIVADSAHIPDGPGPYVMGADTLKGDNVVNAAGDHLGKIETIMLDVGSGRVAYAVLTFGGVFGIGGKLFAVPWSALILDAVEKRFVLDVTKEQLENAPGFDKDHWPSMADNAWASQIHTHYHARPYWNDEMRPERDLQDSVADRVGTLD